MNHFLQDPFLPHIIDAILPKHDKLREKFGKTLDEIERSVKRAEAKVTLICNECGKKRKVSAEGNYNDRCPRCGGVDWDVVEETSSLPAGWTPERWDQALHAHHVGNRCDGE